jgi:hypothetical protein
VRRCWQSCNGGRHYYTTTPKRHTHTRNTTQDTHTPNINC